MSPCSLVCPAGSGILIQTHLRGDDAPSGLVDEPDEPRAREDRRGHEERGGEEVVRMAGGCGSLSAVHGREGWAGKVRVLVIVLDVDLLVLTVEDYQSEC